MRKLEERSWWAELVQLKDVLSLRELAERYGVAPAAISNALKRNNLSRTAAPPGPRAKRDEDLLARAQEAITRLGTATPARRGRPPRAAAVSAEAAPAVSAAVSAPVSAPVAAPRAVVIDDGTFAHKAWRVSIDSVDYIIVADDVVGAARVATTANKGSVTRIELIGRAISA
jgi:hypothetical protein